MGVEVTRLLRRHSEFLRAADAMARAASNARFVDGRDGQRRCIADQSTVIITTAGMLGGGQAVTYFPEIHADSTNARLFSGYQVEGTPSRRILETGSIEVGDRHLQVSATVEAFDFSAHADRAGLLEFLEAYRDTPLVVNHGDACAWFAADLEPRGHDARPPAVGDTLEV